MFREELHNSFDSISPSPGLLERVSDMIAEEAAKPKPKIYMSAVKFGGMAAAVCIIVAGAVILGGRNNKPETGTDENIPAVTVNSAKESVHEEIFMPTTDDMREESFNENSCSQSDTEPDNYDTPRSRGVSGYRSRPKSML